MDNNGASTVAKIPLNTRRRVPVQPLFIDGEIENVICHTGDRVVRVWNAHTGQEMYDFSAKLAGTYVCTSGMTYHDFLTLIG